MTRYIEKISIITLFLLIIFSLNISNNILAEENYNNKDIDGGISIDDYKSQKLVEDSFPLIIYGGEPEGVSAAISAARSGIKTLLILHRDKPGGLMTYGGLNFLDINNAPDGDNLNKGLFAEWHKNVGGNISFSIEKATEVFENMLAMEENITIVRNAKLVSILKDDNFINSIIIETDSGIKELKAEYFIDASQDADFAVNAGALYFNGGADLGLPDRHMAVTIVLHLANIDWSKLAIDAKSNKFGPSHINKNNAWGFVKIGQLYKPINKNTKLRGLNIVIEEKGEKSEVYINALLVFNVNPTDHNSLKEAYRRGKEEAVHVVSFLQENLGGFKEAKILSFPEELYVRESRHIISQYQLKVEDLFNNRVFRDTIALVSYPLDYQASNPQYNGFVLFNPDVYGIPIRSLLPLGIDNLFVVGRSSGYSSLAAASARVIPTGMATAEAAGLITAYAIKNNLELDKFISNPDLILDIQKKLGINETIKRYNNYIGKNLVFEVNQSSLLDNDSNVFNRILTFTNSKVNRTEDNFPLYTVRDIKEHLEYLLSWGLLVGGYQNDFLLNKEMSEREFAHIIVKGLKQQKAEILYEWVPGGLETMSNNQPLTRNQAAMLLMVAISKRVADLNEDEYFQTAIEYDLIPEIIKFNIKENRLLSRAEAYILISSFLQKYPINESLKFYRGEW